MTPFEQYRVSQHLMKWILVSHSPQHDLPQFSGPQVPSANSKLSQLQGWTPSQWSLFSLVLLVLDVWHSIPTKLFLSVQNLSSMLPCSWEMGLNPSVLFRWFILWASELHCSFVLGNSRKVVTGEEFTFTYSSCRSTSFEIQTENLLIPCFSYILQFLVWLALSPKLKAEFFSTSGTLNES